MRSHAFVLDPKQWRDVAYCLTLLNYTEKSFKKLSDLFKFYKDAIADEIVYESLLGIAAKVIINQEKFHLLCARHSSSSLF
jgi:condensin complex subunit 1